ncbi:MAG TPA: peptide chain release factor N(5)-glutamine methyltransferase [Gaiellaceae bacterium]
MIEAVTLRRALTGADEYLSRRGVERARFEAELIFSQTLGQSRIQLYMDLDRPLTADERGRALELVERRGKREPLAYVLGEWGFRRLTLKTDARALVPRPETEILVERALALIEQLEQPRVLDAGTGSGAIALAIADEHPGARVVAIDSSREALELARENAAACGLEIELRQGDLRGPIARDPVAGEFDLVVSNPPYVLPEEIELLEPEVRDWEPREALVGVGVPEAVAERARELLVPGGWLAIELGEGQQAAYAALVGDLGYEAATITNDLTGRERVVVARWP